MEKKFDAQGYLQQIVEVLSAERVSEATIQKIDQIFLELEVDAGYLEERRSVAESQFSQSLQHVENLNKIIDKYKAITNINPFDKKLPDVETPVTPKKKKYLSFPKIGVGTSDMGGKGVFALEKIYSGEPVELVPALICEREHLNKTALFDYYFNVEDGTGKLCAVAFGYGSIYNHSDNPSAHWIIDVDGKEIIYISTRDIEEGEEITISYGPGYWNEPKRAAIKKEVRTL
jgi:hypothetical protein